MILLVAFQAQTTMIKPHPFSNGQPIHDRPWSFHIAVAFIEHFVEHSGISLEERRESAYAIKTLFFCILLPGDEQGKQNDSKITDV